MSSKQQGQILMVKPDFFEIQYQINPYMDLNKKIDTKKAVAQWEQIKKVYEDWGYQIKVLEAVEGLPDMVFSANQFFFYQGKIILSNMAHPERRGEVAYFEQALKDYPQYRVEGKFEGNGDLITCFTSGRLFGGFGKRTDVAVYDLIEKKLEVPITRLELIDERFYHLDTCLFILNGNTAIVAENAFTSESFQILQKSFSELILVDPVEAQAALACNGFCPDGKRVLIEKKAHKLRTELLQKGFEVSTVDTSEFLKGGGSVFCMKNFLFPN